ncbi:MAG: FAD-dependent oxidoreductase, partial [Deltaproteobacteria bacterium]|nr:FAD-dependent oxidoreductase [Deltaproteobacteria bacterium]
LRGRLTPYPFQVHLAGHEKAFVRRCLRDFARERIREAVEGEGTAPKHFAEWLLRRFGGAMCRAFFFPYNEKMWRWPLTAMTYEWTDWSVPVPRFEDLLAGTRGELRSGMGYNPTFLYPRRGGMGAFVSALAGPVAGRLRTGTRAERLDLGRREIRTAQGERIRYGALVATIPLPSLAAIAEGLPAGSREAAADLRWTRVLAINMGVRRPGRTPGHWIYVPEGRRSFFRVGFLSNVAPSTAPRGCVSLFVEKSFLPGEGIDVEREVRLALRGLRRMGVLTGRSRVEEIRPVVLDPAYVLFDRARAAAVPALRRAFERRGVFPAGRYGSWDYFGVGKAMADGIRAAGEAIRFHGR